MQRNSTTNAALAHLIVNAKKIASAVERCRNPITEAQDEELKELAQKFAAINKTTDTNEQVLLAAQAWHLYLSVKKQIQNIPGTASSKNILQAMIIEINQYQTPKLKEAVNNIISRERYFEPLNPSVTKEVTFSVMTRYNKHQGITNSAILPCEVDNNARLMRTPITKKASLLKKIIKKKKNTTKEYGTADATKPPLCYIGAIPSKEDLLAIPNNNKIDVFSVVDYFELADARFIKPADCEKYGWGHTILPWTDYSKGNLPMEASNLLNIAQMMVESKENGRIPFIHCKTGAGRSVALAAAYLAISNETPGNKDGITAGERLKNALLHINASRKEADLHDELLYEICKNTKYTWDDLLKDNGALLLTDEFKTQNASINGQKVHETITKLLVCYQSIELNQQLKLEKQNQAQTTPVAQAALSLTVAQSTPGPVRYPIDNETFLNRIVQRAPFKELQMLRLKYLKNTVKDPTKKLLNAMRLNDTVTWKKELEKLAHSKDINLARICKRLNKEITHYQKYGTFSTKLPKLNDIELGRIYVQLMLEIKRNANLPIKEIQFNFCLQPNPPISSDNVDIKRAIKAYIKSTDATIQQEVDKLFANTPTLKKNILKVSLPSDASQLPIYSETLASRGKSFQQAAEMILNNCKYLDSTIKDKLQNNLSKLFKEYKSNIKNIDDSSVLQAHYDAYIDAIKNTLKSSLNIDDNEVKKYLQNAEQIVNIKKQKSHVTISGAVNIANPLDGNIRVQIDEPRKQFKDLSQEQKIEWRKAINAYNNNITGKISEWFTVLPEFEKQYWATLFSNKNTQELDNIYVGPVVKKQGMPSLRNLNLSSFMTMNYDGKNNKPTVSISAKSVRSSNLVVQPKDATATLTEEQKKLTSNNIHQVIELYKNNPDMNGTSRIPEKWSYQSKHEPFVLCQTLVRLAFGGDTYVLPHKKAAADSLNNPKVLVSNHCIGTAATISKTMHLAMHIGGANTKGINHVVGPVEEFINDAVKINLNNKDAKDNIESIFSLAKKGSLTFENLNNTIEKMPELKNLNSTESAHLTCVLLALNQYVAVEKKPSSYLKRYQLHMAALEEIIYQDTGNIIQSSCKSGKDREGVLKCYRNAMRAYFDEYGNLPPAEKNAEGRAEFVKIFMELFNSNHQARLAELNAAGCEGQKALRNILPADILVEVDKQLLLQHKQNSTLNDFGKSAVKHDANVYNDAKEKYEDIALDTVANNLNMTTSTINQTATNQQQIQTPAHVTVPGPAPASASISASTLAPTSTQSASSTTTNNTAPTITLTASSQQSTTAPTDTPVVISAAITESVQSPTNTSPSNSWTGKLGKNEIKVDYQVQYDANKQQTTLTVGQKNINKLMNRTIKSKIFESSDEARRLRIELANQLVQAVIQPLLNAGLTRNLTVSGTLSPNDEKLYPYIKKCCEVHGYLCQVEQPKNLQMQTRNQDNVIDNTAKKFFHKQSTR